MQFGKNDYLCEKNNMNDIHRIINDKSIKVEDKYKDLRAKTVFDFCDDYESVFEKIYGFPLLDPEDELRKMKENSGYNAFAIVGYACFIEDEEFQVAIIKIFADEFTAVFNE
jgi:hypothetical protein